MDEDLCSKRISKACDQCRAKKIKCDGFETCSKCSIKGTECTYNYVHKQRMKKDGGTVEKPKVKRGRPKKIIIRDTEIESDSSSPHENAFGLENRLAMMEEMMHALMKKVSSSQSSPASFFTGDFSSVANPIGKPSSDMSSISTVTSNTLLSTEKRNTPEQVVSVVYESGMFLQTSMFILSPPGLKWVESTLKNPKTLSPLVSIIKFAAPFEQNLLAEWVDPVEQSNLQPLPDRIMIEELFKYLKLSICITRVIDIGYLEKLFKEYCDFRDNLIPEPQFTYGDYLLMNSSLLIACSTLVELATATELDTPEGLSLEEIRLIEHKLFDNAIFYYHRCSVISHGIPSISGSIILAFYADSISLSRAAFLIGSTAIRQAQQMGLHREESYRGLSPTERSIRLKIWWTSYIFDKEMCFRWGHSPVINDDDVSAPALPGTEAFWSFNERTAVKTRDRRVYDIQAMLDGLTTSDNLVDLDLYINVDYAFIISDVYRTLLSANSIKKASHETIIATRDSLFKDLDTWRSTLPVKLRPTEVYSKEFKEAFSALGNDPSSSNIYWIVMISSFNIRYHHLRMIIGRTTSHYLCELEYENPGISPNPDHIRIGLGSARAVLEVACLVDSRFGNYANYLIFYPFNAFLTISAFYIYKSDGEADIIVKDLELLMAAVNTYFNPFSDDNRRNEKGWLFSAVAKCMLFITIQSIEDKGTKLNFSEQFLSECDKIFDPIKAFMDEDIHIDDLVLTVRNKMQLLDVKNKQFASLPVNFKSQSEFSPLSAVNTPQYNDFSVASMLNTERNAQRLQQPQQISHSIAGADMHIENGNDWNFDGTELFLQNMLNIPNYMMESGVDK